MQEPEVTAGRVELGFEAAVRSEFAFLASLGYEVSGSEVTRVQYLSSDHFVTIYHGRSSHEIGVEIGLRPNVGEKVQFSSSLWDAVPVLFSGSTEAQEIVGSNTAWTAVQVTRVVKGLASLTQKAMVLLVGDSTAYIPIKKALREETRKMMDEARANKLRQRAIDSWACGSWSQVVTSYLEIKNELSTQNLRPSELMRLRIATRRQSEN